MNPRYKTTATGARGGRRLKGYEFPKLGKDNLEKRLAWDSAHLEKLTAFFDKRVAEVFPWEIDQRELEKLHSGDFGVDAQTKLDSWILSGKEKGYRFELTRNGNDWLWYRADGSLARHASRHADGAPVHFYWYHPNSAVELRKETFAYKTGELTSRRWCHPKGGNIRYESPGSWTWYGKDQQIVRMEWDDNGDGIPDWFMVEADKIDYGFDRNVREKRKALKLEESWAIHPDLIPVECGIFDQPELRVPIKRKVSVEGLKK